MHSPDSIIEKIYDAALDPTQWEALLGDIAAAIDAVAGLYAGLDIRHGRGAYWYAAGHDPRMQVLYNEHYRAIDPTLAHVIEAPGRAFACSDYLTDADIAASRFHTEFLIPNGIRYVISGVVSKEGSMVSFFGFQRQMGQPPFGQAEVDFVQRLIPHFAKADRVAAKVNTVSAARQLAMTVLDRMDYGIVIVDRTGHVRMTNQRAEKWLQAGDILQSVFGRIRLSIAADHDAMISLIHAAGARPDAHARTMELNTPDGTTRVRLAVLPISHDEKARLEDDEASVVLVLSDSHQQRATASHVLQNGYGLTAAEAKVATGLAGGQTQDELSAALHVSMATIKTHTQRIYRKIGVSRQVDLVRLVFGLPAWS
jgi:DNA-binding CsgD family transcriptional regulator